MFNIDFSSVTNSWRFLLDGASFTLELTLVAVAGGLLLGTLIAVARLSHKWWLKTLASAYVNAIRSVPLVLLLFWVFFLMPELLRYLVGASRPITVEASVSAMVTFVVFEAAYFAEIIRAGIGSIKSGRGRSGLGAQLRADHAFRDPAAGRKTHVARTFNPSNRRFSGYELGLRHKCQ